MPEVGPAILTPADYLKDIPRLLSEDLGLGPPKLLKDLKPNLKAYKLTQTGHKIPDFKERRETIQFFLALWDIIAGTKSTTTLDASDTFVAALRELCSK